MTNIFMYNSPVTPTTFVIRSYSADVHRAHLSPLHMIKIVGLQLVDFLMSFLSTQVIKQLNWLKIQILVLIPDNGDSSPQKSVPSPPLFFSKPQPQNILINFRRTSEKDAEAISLLYLP